ncbi:MAG: AAA family ATPase [Magnetococcus sp. XQGC-1]
MIIQAVQAENLFKYSKLSLTGLAPRGRILLSGPNESGKTAIVEAICLGLFGRTAALDSSQLAKMVKWGEKQGSVTLQFSGSDNVSYTVSRYLDSAGHCQATLSRTGEAEALAKGVAAVDQAIMALIGFDFRHYTETLFLAQGDSDGAARESTIQALAGVAELHALDGQLSDEMVTIQQEIAEGEALQQTLQEQLLALDLQEDALGILEEQRAAAAARVATIDQELERWQRLSDDMQRSAATIESVTDRLLQCGTDTTLDTWRSRSKSLGQAIQEMDDLHRQHQVETDVPPGAGLRTALNDLKKRLSEAVSLVERVANHRYELAVWLGMIPGKEESETLHQAQTRCTEQHALCDRRRGQYALLFTLSLLLALLVGGAGGVLQFQAESEWANTLSTLLKTVHPGWDPALTPLLFAVAVVFLLLSFNGAGQSFGLRRTMAALDQEWDQLESRAVTAREMVQAMDAAANDSFSRQVAALSQLAAGEWLEDLQQWAMGAGKSLLEEGTRQKLLAQFQTQLEQFRQEVAADVAEIAGQCHTSQEERQRLTESILQLDREIETEQARRQQDRELRAREAAVLVEREQHIHQIAVRRVACALLQGTCVGLSTRFNQELRRFIAKAAPLFTQGRYQHVRIDDRLQVAAFSTVKNDFVDFGEISSGVRHQLLLAVRVALVQALVARVGSGPQFIVLDEPFVFFDRQRIQESLEALLHVSEQISQVWVIAQEYGKEMIAKGDLHIQCLADEATLVLHQDLTT